MTEIGILNIRQAVLNVGYHPDSTFWVPTRSSIGVDLDPLPTESRFSCKFWRAREFWTVLNMLVWCVRFAITYAFIPSATKSLYWECILCFFIAPFMPITAPLFVQSRYLADFFFRRDGPKCRAIFRLFWEWCVNTRYGESFFFSGVGRYFCLLR